MFFFVWLVEGKSIDWNVWNQNVKWGSHWHNSVSPFGEMSIQNSVPFCLSFATMVAFVHDWKPCFFPVLLFCSMSLWIVLPFIFLHESMNWQIINVYYFETEAHIVNNNLPLMVYFCYHQEHKWFIIIHRVTRFFYNRPRYLVCVTSL